jgi:phosphoribosylglycinamide formyltransferase-1
MILRASIRAVAKLDVVVLVSGKGSNLRAILAAIDAGRCDARIAAVVADRDAEGLALAKERGIATRVVKPKDFADRAAWDAALAEVVAGLAPGLVVLAGFMRIVGAEMLLRFPHRIVNVHPALLPAFPGTDGPAQAIAKRVRVSGCTVHLVDAGVDTGPILAQAAVPVLPGDDAASLHARIQREEHRLLPAVVDAIARGWIALGEVPSFSPECPFDEAAIRCPALS